MRQEINRLVRSAHDLFRCPVCLKEIRIEMSDRAPLCCGRYTLPVNEKGN